MGAPRNTVERMLKLSVEVTSTCWLWRGPVTPNGYGKATISRKTTGAHRVFYQHFNGPAPAGAWVVHLCKNKLCVNPLHLKAMSSTEGNLFSTSPSAINTRKTHCIRGHSLTGRSLYITPDGRRQCVTCRKAALAKSRGKKWKEAHLA